MLVNIYDAKTNLSALLDKAVAGAEVVIARADEVAFSEASIWEIGLKWRKGKINLQPRRVVEQALRDGFRMRALSLEPILLSCELQQKHDDPFDRLLYAQAK